MTGNPIHVHTCASMHIPMCAYTCSIACLYMFVHVCVCERERENGGIEATEIPSLRCQLKDGLENKTTDLVVQLVGMDGMELE